MVARRTLRPEPERALVDRLLAALRSNGWRAMHRSDSRMIVNIGGRFEVVADPECAGWPDIFAVCPATGRQVAIECKQDGRYPRQNQVEWLDDLGLVGVETFVCWPSNEAEVMGRLLRVPVPA